MTFIVTSLNILV